ncbi:hypothetical protein RvY_00107 [Ramazzottius varieornatus]|uniref:Uncharacterized protein n=1 Tax=Ramazzottius varieornatus TaxID=947166 RepID=A0A1D1UBK0_RAMVA|nr:hypothetical protein RvY_00107 [Ramazzottius varieornatus]
MSLVSIQCPERIATFPKDGDERNVVFRMKDGKSYQKVTPQGKSALCDVVGGRDFAASAIHRTGKAVIRGLMGIARQTGSGRKRRAKKAKPVVVGITKRKRKRKSVAEKAVSKKKPRKSSKKKASRKKKTNKKARGLANFANYAEALLGYGPPSKEQLELQGIHLDTAGSHDTTVTTPTNAAMTNSRLRNRYNQLKGDQTCKLRSRFPSELAKQPLLIRNRMDIKLILHRAKAASYMMSEEEALGLKLILTSAQLKIRKIKMDPEFLVAHEILLAKRNALIFFEGKNVLELTINAGVMSFARDDLFRGIISKKVILALVDSAAIAGHYKKNPLKVESVSLSQVGFIVNGENLPSRPLQFTPGNGFERDGYLSLLETTGLILARNHDAHLYRDSILEIDQRRNPFLPYKHV